MTRKDSYTPEERRAYTSRWRARRRRAALQQLGGKCAKCARRRGLHFDHIDRTTKVASIADMWTASAVKFTAELAKCQLLCRRHHLEKSREAGDVLPQPAHGSLGRYARYGCRCEVCTRTMRAYRHRYWHANKETINEGRRKLRRLGREANCA